MKTAYLYTWKFWLEGTEGSASDAGIASDPWSPSFDDRGFKEVVVPHDWAVTFPFSREWSSGTGYLPGGTAWYRCEFDSSILGEELGVGRRASITFEGVYKNSQVWLNGSYLGRRPSGYVGFSYDITHCLKKGRNLLAVKVSHEDFADSRWYTGSGIYRRVFIDLHDEVYVDPRSVVVETKLSNGAAEAIARFEAANAGACAAEGARVRASLVGPAGERYETEATVSRIAAGATAPLELRIPVPSPRLWSADSPSLYRLTLELRSRAGERETSFESKPIAVGIRSIRFDPDKGFFINGKGEKLRGVCFHHDSGCLGAAFWPDVWRRRLAKLKAAGCNAVRCSHNPQAPELYDLCDELGLYVMDEAFDEWEGCKNKWWRGHNVYPPVHQGYYEDFPQWHERDLADMVIRDRNHPSVILWSIGNEIDYPNDPYVHPRFAEMTGNNDANKPQEERRYNPDKPNMDRLATIAAELVGIVKKHDTTRPVLAAAAFPELSSSIGFFDALDLVGYNYKEQFYEADHRRFPRLPILGSENGHRFDAWKAVRDNDFIGGQFLWTGIDFLGEALGWPRRCSGAGLLDTAGNEKIAYHRRRVIWGGRPALYLATCLADDARGGEAREPQPWELARRWDYAAGAPVTVVCYANVGAAELFVNGRSLGAKRRDESLEYVSWTVPFERGRLEVRGAADVSAVADCLESTLPASKLGLGLWDAPAQAGPGRDEACGYWLAQVEIEALDAEGRLCADASPLVEIAVSPGSRLIGLENGDIADCEEYPAPRRRAHCGRLIAYALVPKAASGGSWLEASAEGMPRARIELAR